MQPDPTLTIGYLTPTVAEGNGLLLWQGILEQVRAFGARLVTFSGGELRYPEPFYRRANQVYELADRQRLDGVIIWTSSLAAFIGDEGIQNFCLRFAPLPVIGIGMPLEGIPTMILESYKGMREAILHLVQTHGKRRIAFIRGPERHYDAQERLRAYRDVVNEFYLDDDPGLVTAPCRWIDRDAGKALQHIVETLGIQFDSVASVNDTLAYGAMQYLQEKGFRLPQEIAVVGFDNNPIGRVCTPPLTTVPNRMRERGRQAVQMLFKKIRNEAVPEIVTLPTGIKVRQSCGCQDPYIVQAGRPAVPVLHTSPTALREEILSLLLKAVPSEANLPDWPEHLLNAFDSSLDEQTDQKFLSMLHELLRPFVSIGLESREWQAALSELRHWLLLQNPGQLERIEFGDRLLHQGRIMIGEITTRSRAYQEWVRSRRLNELHRLRQAISASETLSHLLDILAEELPRLGISCGCMALYQNSEQPLEAARILLAFNKEGRLPQLEGQTVDPSSDLVPPMALEFPNVPNLMIHPLHFGNEQLGFLIVDGSAMEGSSHQVLREQISSALKNVLLIEQNMQLYRQAQHNQHLAEEASQLKSRFLSIVSHELLTPIVLLVGLSEMMLREGIGNRPPLPEAYRQDLTRIHASSQQLGSLVRDVLDLSRSQLGQLTLTKRPIEIKEMLKPVELVGEQMATSKGLLWQVELPADLPLVMGDVSRLQQVLLNLVSNAVKFTSQGSVSVKVDAEDSFVRISICDTGISVPAGEQKAIFDEFHQSERTVTRGFGGLGIGLAICRQLVEMHGGKIGVHSTGEENSGSTFYFTLPAISTLSLATNVQALQTVVILTEQAQSSAVLSQHLIGKGFRVQVIETAGNPNWIESVHSSPQGALVLDFQESQKGWEILESLKRNPATQELPIIFYSLLQEADSGAMLSMDYLAKPVAASHLTQILKRYGIQPESGTRLQTILVVDDDPGIIELHSRMLTEQLPTCQVLTARNGREALEILHNSHPALVLLDLMMPEVDGMAVLKAMQEDKRLQGIPVIVVTAQQLTAGEMAKLNEGVASVLSKGVFTAAETLAQIDKALARHSRLGSENQNLVRKVMAYIHEHYDQNVSRKDLASYAGVSERHLNRCFNQEIGLTSLHYLNRYRIQQAKKLLEQTQLSITAVMSQVGFSESSHFAHVFRREVGISPSAYKRGERPRI